MLSKRGMMKRLLGAHVESSHTSTQIHGRYLAQMPKQKTISLDIDVIVFPANLS
jgi:hypothetical protein